MSTILLKADFEEVNIDNLDSYHFHHVTRHDMSKLVRIEGFVDKFVQRNLSRWEQDVLNDYANLSIDQCMSIIKNSDGTPETCIVNKYKELPLDFLNEYAGKLPLYYIEHQVNIDPDFFAKHRTNMDVSSFLQIRAEVGDVFKFLGPNDNPADYMKRAINYRLSRDTLIANVMNIKPDVDQVELNKMIDEFFNHPVNVEYLTECYQQDNVSHTVRDVVRYYNNHHRTNYTTWSEFIAHALREADTALADVWFNDTFAPRIFSLIKG